MTGKELIIYILEHNLEDVDLLENGLKPLFMSPTEAAVKWGCGVHTVGALIKMGKVKGVKIGDEYFVLDIDSELCKK